MAYDAPTSVDADEKGQIEESEIPFKIANDIEGEQQGRTQFTEAEQKKIM